MAKNIGRRQECCDGTGAVASSRLTQRLLRWAAKETDNAPDSRVFAGTA
jgi:hypothetical protein